MTITTLAVLVTASTPGAARGSQPANSVFGLVAPVNGPAHAPAASSEEPRAGGSWLDLFGLGSRPEPPKPAPQMLSHDLGEAELRAELGLRAQNACDRPRHAPVQARHNEARMPWILAAFDARNRDTGEVLYLHEQRMQLGIDRLFEVFATFEPLAPGTARCYQDWAEQSLARHQRFDFGTGTGTGPSVEVQQLQAVREAAQAAQTGATD